MDLREKLNEHRRKNFLCDVNLIVEKSQFPAHKFVLAATAEYFSKMFVDEVIPPNQTNSSPSSAVTTDAVIPDGESADQDVDNGGDDSAVLNVNNKEKEEQCNGEGQIQPKKKIISDVELQGVRSNGFESLLHFLYTARFHCKQETVLDVLHNARVLNLTDIVQKCLMFLCENVTVAQCVPVYQMALNHNYFSLVCTCKQLLLNRFSEVLTSKTFLELSPVLLCQLLSDDSLKISDEKLAMRAVVKWIMHDITSRKSFADRMLSSIRFSYISTSDFLFELDKCKDVAYLKERFEVCQVFRSEKSPLSSMNGSLDSNCSPGAKENPKFPELVSMQHIPRKSYRPRILITGGVSSYRNNIIDWIDQYDLFTHSWSQCNRLAISRSGHALVQFDNRFTYLIGGQRSPEEILASVEILDLAEDKFKQTSYSLLKPRKWFNAVQYGRSLYVIGGYSPTGPLDSIECFNPKSANNPGWTVYSSLDVSIFSFASVVVGQELFISGGVVNNGNSDALRVFCFKSKKMSSRASMHSKRSQHCLVAVRDCLYAIGGRNCTDGVLNSVERYSIIEDTWTKVSDMSVGRAGACAVVVDGLVYVMGGRAHLGCQQQQQNMQQQKKNTGNLSSNISPGVTSGECFAEVYDPLTNQWNPLSLGTNTCASRSYAAATLLQPLINS